MPTNRTPIYRHQSHRLSFSEEMDLEWGRDTNRPAFRSDNERREAWARNRDYLLRRWQRGRRPEAWWSYAAPIRYPRDHDYEAAALWDAGLLSETESAELVALWREYFDQAQEPRFEHCIGHAKEGDTFASWLEGAAAKHAHYKWAGIPRELIRKWSAERRRRDKIIRRLRSANPAGTTA